MAKQPFTAFFRNLEANIQTPDVKKPHLHIAPLIYIAHTQEGGGNVVHIYIPNIMYQCKNTSPNLMMQQMPPIIQCLTDHLCRFINDTKTKASALQNFISRTHTCCRHDIRSVKDIGSY